MEVLGQYLKFLTDASEPSHRVVRKTAAISIGICVHLIYQRHFPAQLDAPASLPDTIVISLQILVFIGVVGGSLSAAFYELFRKDIGASSKHLTSSVFVAEWLFAATSPAVACVSIYIVNVFHR